MSTSACLSDPCICGLNCSPVRSELPDIFHSHSKDEGDAGTSFLPDVGRVHPSPPTSPSSPPFTAATGTWDSSGQDILASLRAVQDLPDHDYSREAAQESALIRQVEAQVADIRISDWGEHLRLLCHGPGPEHHEPELTLPGKSKGIVWCPVCFTSTETPDYEPGKTDPVPCDLEEVACYEQLIDGSLHRCRIHGCHTCGRSTIDDEGQECYGGWRLDRCMCEECAKKSVGYYAEEGP